MSATAAPLTASAAWVEHQLEEVGRLVGAHERELCDALVQLQRATLELKAVEPGAWTTPIDHPYRPELLRHIEEKRREVARLKERVKHLKKEAAWARVAYSRLRLPRAEHRSDELEHRFDDLLVGRACPRERRDSRRRSSGKSSRDSPSDKSGDSEPGPGSGHPAVIHRPRGGRHP